MNYEHLKSTLLIILIGISVILTWQLYTFQPEIALLDDTVSRYVPDSLNEEREERVISEVVRPEQIIVHRDEQYGMIGNDEEKFDLFYEKLLATNLNEVNLLSTDRFPTQTTGNGVELVFPTSLPTSIFLALFGIYDEELAIPTLEIDRLFLFIDQGNAVHMQALASEEERLIEFETSLSVGDFESNYLEPFEEYTEVMTVLDETASKRLSENIYLPVDPVYVDRLSFATSPLSSEFFKQSLFTD